MITTLTFYTITTKLNVTIKIGHHKLQTISLHLHSNLSHPELAVYAEV